jgi:PhoPQ-activated pathogenicity-related protein
MQTTPQNLQIEHLTSKLFHLQFIHKIQTDNFQLFIESILSDLMDAIGDNFKASVKLYKNKKVLESWNKSSILIRFQEYHWISEIGIKISEFLEKTDQFLYVTLGTTFENRSNEYEYISFDLVAKDGVYIEKKMTSIEVVYNKIDDIGSFCYGRTVPNYSVNTIDF